MVESITTEECSCCKTKFQATYHSKVMIVGKNKYARLGRSLGFTAGAILGAKIAYDARPETGATIGTAFSMLFCGWIIGAISEITGGAFGGAADQAIDDKKRFAYVCENCIDDLII